MKNDPEEWKTDIEDAAMFTPEKVAWVKEEAEKALAYHLSCLDAVRDQTMKIMGFLFIIITALCGWLVQRESVADPAGFAGVCMTLYLAFLAVLLALRNMSPAPVRPPGNDPSCNMTREMFSYDLALMMAGHVEVLESSIRYNRARNRKRAETVRKVLVCIAFAPALALSAWGVATCFL